MNTFDPVLYSINENKFLHKHLGEAPIVALKSVDAGVNPAAVKPVLQEVYDLIEQEKHDGTPWTGLDKLRKAIEAYITQAERWSTDKRRGAKRFPSMYSFDSRKRAFRGGPGSDSGQVRTYFGPAGERIPFAVELIPASEQEWTPDFPVQTEGTSNGLKVDPDASRIECPICKHTESYNPESRGSYSAARARISKHLRLAKTEVDAHRELHTAEFGAPA